MLRYAILGVVLGLIGCEQTHWSGQEPMAVHQTYLPDQISWGAAPPGLPAGAKAALLEGDPSKPGFFTLRVSLPDNYKIAPHYHPTAERITVLSGTLQLAEGDSFDTSRLQDLPAGSYATMPAGMHHFASTKGQTVIQLSTIGPWGITYLNPADDPRTRVEAK